MEAAEAHAWQLDQLALNLSRYGARRGYPGGSQDLEETPMLRRAPRRRGRCPAGAGGARAQVDRRSTAGSRGACTRVGPWGGGGPPSSRAPVTPLGPPTSSHSIIRGVNQDRFIQRAIEAANAYSSILQAVQAAEGAARQARQQASHTWAVRPCPSPQPPKETHSLPDRCQLCRVPVSTDGGAAGPGAPSPAALGQQQCPGRGRPWGAAEAGPRWVQAHLGVRVSGDPLPWATPYRVCVRVAAAPGSFFALGVLPGPPPPWFCDGPPGRGDGLCRGAPAGVGVGRSLCGWHLRCWWL